MLDSIIRWLVVIAVWIIRQYQGMQLGLERTMATEELQAVMGGPDPFTFDSIPNVSEELLRMSAYSCSVP